MASAPFKVKAVYEYNSPHEDDLSFPNGQIITVTEEEDADWYIGEYTDGDGTKQDGLFPRNFVEKYEPAAPPRPTRTRPKKETAPIASETTPEPAPQPVETQPPVSETMPAHAEEPQPAPTPADPAPATAETKAEPVKATQPGKGPPPPVSEKPQSFKDRIAAFNKGTASPLAPAKPGPPGGGGSSYAIKKPFVAAPPARDSYVAPPRDPAPQKVYRREEDPEIMEKQKQDQEDAEKAGLVSGEAGQGAEEEETKSTSLKDRIALLQKQQQEQATRRAEGTQKEKPPRPQKRPTDPIEHDIEPAPVEDEPALEKVSSPQSRPRQSMESARDVPRPPPTARMPSNQLVETSSDGNEADQSGAGETTEDGEGESTEVDELEDKASVVQQPQAPSRTSTNLSRKSAAEPERIAQGEEEEPQDDEEEEDEVDEETRRKEELRARMAKMSGGMGMPGMFGGPAPGGGQKSKRQSSMREQKSQAESDLPPSSPPIPQRAPMVPVPGLPQRPPTDSQEASPEVTKELEAGLSLSENREPEEVPDLEDLTTKSPMGSHLTERAAPPIPQGNDPSPPSPQKLARNSRREALVRSRSINGSRHSRTYSAYDGAPVMVIGSRGPNRPLPPPPPSQPKGAPPVPIGRPGPPPPPRDIPTATSGGTVTGDNMSNEAAASSHPAGPRSPPTTRSSQILEPTSPSSLSDKRSSRAVPPIPAMPPVPTAETRPPPPPPPTAAPPSRRSTDREIPVEPEEENRDSEYEGDYDTDIASGARHRDALGKVQDREGSIDESPLSDDNKSPIVAPPPVPSHRGVPPLPPSQVPTIRPSVDVPRAPPPAPPPRDDDYDPYSYHSPTHGVPSPGPRTAGDPLQQESNPSLYGAMPIRSGPGLTGGVTAHDRAPPPPPPEASPQPNRELSRKSLEIPRQSMTGTRKSTEMSRPSMEHGTIAQDVDLGAKTTWWTQPQIPPPVFQKRSDILCDYEESTTARRGGRSSVERTVYVLFRDYSQSVITARFDPKDPAEAHLEQRHQPPPPQLRQDQLEEAHARLGQTIVDAASKRANHTAGDGTGQALIHDILQGIPTALLPIGTRAYGALVYANMANATVTQLDEIRPGDIISFRNAKFAGKHGAMHAKYSEDVGKPEHVGVVAEWDGTKKKVRAFEQGREPVKTKGKMRVEVQSSRLADLRSGEVKVWRVMEKGWVGWE